MDFILIMVNKSIVGPKGQITLPKAIREKYHLLEGEEVFLVPQEEGGTRKAYAHNAAGNVQGKA